MHQKIALVAVAAIALLVSQKAPAQDATEALGYSRPAPERLILAQERAEPEERPVSYSMEQADRGEDRFKRECVECHGDDLKGGMNGGPPLRGGAFEEKYFGGLPATVMFSFMISTMPPNAPGRYSETIYADLMAYILEKNGFQPGAPLPSEYDSLDYMIIEK